MKQCVVAIVLENENWQPFHKRKYPEKVVVTNSVNFARKSPICRGVAIRLDKSLSYQAKLLISFKVFRPVPLNNTPLHCLQPLYQTQNTIKLKFKLKSSQIANRALEVLTYDTKGGFC